MDHRRQKQMINQMLDANSKTDEELNNMSSEERKAYLLSRLQQKMFFSTAQRRSNFQKQQLQEKFQEKLKENNEQTESETVSKAKTERNRRKRQKKREKLRSQKTDNNNEGNDEDDVVVVNNPDESTESDYHSD